MGNCACPKGLIGGSDTGKKPGQFGSDAKGLREARPAHRFPNGAVYTGEWVGEKRDGYGVQNWPDGAVYQGQWQDDKAHGYGKFVHTDGDIFEGEWMHDKAHGQGTYYHEDGSKIHRSLA